MRPVPGSILICACLALAACETGRAEPEVVVEEAWIQLPAIGGRPGAAYFTLTTNNDPTKLLAVSSPRVERIELHASTMEGGVMRMTPLTDTVFPDDRVLRFAPGGKHAMLFGIDPALKAGDRVALTFTFDPAPPVTMAAEVRAFGEAMPATERPLTEAERALAASMFGSAIDYEPVRIRRRKWFPFQPRNVVMAPSGHIHFHPGGDLWCDDFAAQPLHRQGLFVHEMTHVWQAQKRGRLYLVLMRHPFCRYAYSLKPGWPLARYGVEQQAEIVRHAFLLRHGLNVSGAPPVAQYETLLPFPR